MTRDLIRQGFGLLFGVTALVGPVAAMERPEVLHEPPASWVAVAELDIDAPLAEEMERLDYLVLLDDDQFSVATEERYFRTVGRMRLAGAVQRHSQVEIVVDPTCQKLVVHSFAVIREGKRVEQFDPAKFRFAQVEQDLDSYIFNGKVTAFYFLEDVRVGDVIDVSYTLRGVNPVFGKKFAGAARFQGHLPVQRLRVRVVSPEERLIHHRLLGTDQAPEETVEGGFRALSWEFGPVKSLYDLDWEKLDPLDPGAVPGVLLTEYTRWEEVVDWAMTYYRVEETEDAAVMEAADRIAADHPLEEDRINAAIRLVGGFRYLGIEVGEHSHKPNPPGLVLQRRFGDCKDKTMLLCTLLRRLGVEARPALVHTRSHRHGDRFPPTPFAFNHVVVEFLHGDKRYWVDPTIPLQGGGFRTIFFPRYQTVLMLDGRDNPYGSPQIDNDGDPVTIIRERYRIPGFDGETRLEVEIRHEKFAADRLRIAFANRDSREFAKDYFEQIKEEYPEATQIGEMVFKDDVEDNVYTIEATYSIPKFWRWDRRSKRWYCTFYARDIASLINPGFGRRSPFHQAAKVTHTITVEGTTAYMRPPPSHAVSNSAFGFKTSGRKDGETLVLTYEFEKRADQASGEDQERLARSYFPMLERLRYTAWTASTRSAPGTSADRPSQAPTQASPTRRY